MAGMGYIYLVESLQFLISYTEELPENPDINLDLGIEVPIIGIELGGRSAKKILSLRNENKLFIKKKTNSGEEYFSFRFENKPVQKTVIYEEIEEIKFLFADNNCLDFIGIDILSDNQYYHQYLSK